MKKSEDCTCRLQKWIEKGTLDLVVLTIHATWKFSPVVISFPQKAPPLYEGVDSIPEIFKIYMYVSLY